MKTTPYPITLNEKLVIDNALMLLRKRYEDYPRYDPRNEIGQAKLAKFNEINQIREKVMEL